VNLLFDSIMDVLELIDLEGETSTIRNDAISRIAYLSSFNFAFSLQLMLNILGITLDLSQALQKKDQNIANAMKLVQVTRKSLESMGKDGWDSLMDKTRTFCVKHKIHISNMDDNGSFQGDHDVISRSGLMGFIIGWKCSAQLWIYILKSLDITSVRRAPSFLLMWLA